MWCVFYSAQYFVLVLIWYCEYCKLESFKNDLISSKYQDTHTCSYICENTNFAFPCGTEKRLDPICTIHWQRNNSLPNDINKCLIFMNNFQINLMPCTCLEIFFQEKSIFPIPYVRILLHCIYYDYIPRFPCLFYYYYFSIT